MADLSRYYRTPASSSPPSPLARYYRAPATQGDDDESDFRSWYASRAKRLGLDPNPDAPEHKYDYRAAFRAGLEPDETGHWPSEFKAADHPNRFVGGVDTITGRRADGKEGARALVESWKKPPPAGLALTNSVGAATPRTVGDRGRRLEAAVLSNLSGIPDIAEQGIRLMAGESPEPLVRGLTGFLPRGAQDALVTGASAAQAVMRHAPPLPKWLTDDAVAIVTGAPRAGLAQAEAITGRPFTTASQERARQRFRETGDPLRAPLLEALEDTLLEGVGSQLDLSLVGGTALKAARAAARSGRLMQPPLPGGTLTPDANPVFGRAGRPEPGAAQPGSGESGGAVRSPLGEAGGAGPASVSTGVGESVPLPVGPAFRSEAKSVGAARRAGEAGSHLYGTHWARDRQTAEEFAAQRYGGKGVVREEALPLGADNPPFSVDRNYSSEDLRRVHPEASQRLEQRLGGLPLSGSAFHDELRAVYRDQQIAAGRANDDALLAEEFVFAGKTVQDAGYGGFHQEMFANTPTGTTDAWTVFPRRDVDPRAALGLTPPPGSPGAVGPPIITKPFQTNIAAQIGGQEVADYIIRESDRVAEAIGGPQNWNEVEEMALRLGTTPEDFLARPTQFAQMSKEERVRLTMVIKGREGDILGLKSKLTDGAATAEDQMNLLRLIDEQGALIRLGAGVGSEYGRALNTLKMEARVALTDPVLAKQQLYRRYQKRLDKDKPLLNTLAMLDTNNPDELRGFLLQVSDQPKLREYLQESFFYGILWNPASHVRNILGNATYGLAENVGVPLVRAADSVVTSAVQGGPRQHTFGEALYGMAGFTSGIVDGLAKGFEVLRRGYPVDAPGKFMAPRSAFARTQNKMVREHIGPVLGGGVRALAAEDALFRAMNHQAEVYRQAVRHARSEGAPDVWSRAGELIANPPADIIAAANKFELAATFNDEMSDLAKRVMRVRDAPQLHGAGAFVAPFVKIADRLMTSGFEYTPYGYYKASKSLMADEKATLRARAGIGSAMMLGGAALAANGQLTAAAPRDPAERDAFFRAKKKPWSVRVPMQGVQRLVERGMLPQELALEPDETGNVWVPFQQLQPVAMPLSIVAAAYQGWQGAKEGVSGGESASWASTKELMKSALEVGSFLMDQSYMNGPADFFAALTSRGSDESRVRAATNLVTGPIAGMAPLSGLTKAIAQSVDPRLLDIQSFTDRLRSQIPGATLGIRGRLDVWGEEIVPSGGRLRSVAATGTPLDAAREKVDPLDAELARLGEPLGFVDNRMHDPVTGQSAPLSREEHYEYQRIAGRKTREKLTELFADPDYIQGNDEHKRDRVERYIRISRQYARTELLARRHGWKK